MKEIVLTYPNGDIIDDAVAICLECFCVQIFPKENKLCISASPKGYMLEEVFTQDLISALRKYGVKVETI